MLSRVADSIYWLSRYLERAEHTARVLNLTLNILLEQQNDEAVKMRMNRVLDGLFAGSTDNVSLYDLTNSLAFDPKNAASITYCITRSRENARQIREQISSEMWEHLNGVYLKVINTKIDDVWNDQQTHDFFKTVQEASQLFQGLAASTMSRNESWHFLQLGRYMERATYNAHFLDVHVRELQKSKHYPVISGDFMDWVGLLKCFTAFEAYCKVYTADLKPDKIIEFLLLNREFPHSVSFSVSEIATALRLIEKTTESRRGSDLMRRIGKLQSELNFGEVSEILESGLSPFIERIQQQCARIHDGVYNVYIAYPIDKALAQ